MSGNYGQCREIRVNVGKLTVNVGKSAVNVGKSAVNVWELAVKAGTLAVCGYDTMLYEPIRRATATW